MKLSWVPVLVVGLCVLFAGLVLFSACYDSITFGLMGNVERVSITNVRFVEGTPIGDMIKVTIKNTGTSAVIIFNAYANGTKASNINPIQPSIPKLSSQELTLTYPDDTFVYGSQYQVKLITAKGTSLTSSLTYDITSTSAYDSLVDDIIPAPIPLQASDLPPDLKLSSVQAMILCSSSAIASIAAVGACLFANYALHPKNRKELFMMLFFVTIIVVFTIIAIVCPIIFPPIIGLM